MILISSLSWQYIFGNKELQNDEWRMKNEKWRMKNTNNSSFEIIAEKSIKGKEYKEYKELNTLT